MSMRTRRPVRMAGAVVTSGHLDTGELNVNQLGGQRRFSAFSGGVYSLGSGFPAPLAQTADHVVLWSGAGRLKTVFVHQAISGVALQFYDSAIVARSGPNTFQESGRGLLGAIPPNTWNNNGGTLLGIQVPITFDMPFFSGLAVVGSSGVPGFTLTWTPEAFRSGVADDTF